MPTISPASIKIQEITTTEALKALSAEWSALWRACPSATPFQSPEWLIPWWEHIGEGELWSIAPRDNSGALIGLAPLYIYTDPASGVRSVFPIGIATSDYLDVLAAPGREPKAMDAIFTHLDAQADRWDLCDFQQLPAGSPLLDMRLPRNWRGETQNGEVCPQLRGADSAASLTDLIPTPMRRNLDYYRRRADKMGRVEYVAANAGNLDELFGALLRLHEARWRSRGEPGVLADDRVRQAHRGSLPGLLACGALRLYALRLDGKIIASYYGFADPVRPGPRSEYYYLSGFDPEYASISPGILIVGHAIEQAAQSGCETFDFLRGREEYKYRWGAQDVACYRRVCRRGPIPA